MYKKKADGTYAYSGRFWTYVVIATILIAWIGWRTQATADRVEVQAKETAAFAASTNDCLNQVVSTLKERVGYNDRIGELRDRRVNSIARLIADLARIDTDQPQVQRDAQAAPILATYFNTVNEIDMELQKVQSSRDLTAYPDPSCGFEVPGR